VRRRIRSVAGGTGIAALLALPLALGAQQVAPLRVSLIEMPFSGERNVTEHSPVPEYLIHGGLEDTLRARGVALVPTRTVALTAADDEEYGSWHRMGLANGHLADMVAGNRRDGVLTVGLLANCTSVLGVLGGLQRSRGCWAGCRWRWRRGWP
jgi:hypothetical protein